ncbi:MAG: phage baseplate assembly protein V [Aliihoeflea sp.]|uniref:phage baseplate assembly protein V n=1 Tax=Aliihoeflea sp. TaxID=2608088 RepID=UPI004033B577
MGILERLVELERKVAETERRGRNRRRTGVVSEINHAKGLARVKISDGDRPYLTPWMPWKEIAAGGISSHIPPTTGQQVDVVSENGDLTDAVIDFSTHSNANPRPHDGPEAVIVHGATRMTIGDGIVDIVADLTVTGSVQFNGPSVRHNERNIGDDHTHSGVIRGSADTNEPNS